MAYLNDLVLDLGLNVLDTEANRLDITIGEATTFGEATTDGNKSAGYKTSLSIGAPGAKAGGGRKVTVAAITDGTVTETGTASHWAISDTVNSRLLATGALSSGQVVTDGNTFTLAAFDIGIPTVA
jgi:hypothetical protein